MRRVPSDFSTTAPGLVIVAAWEQIKSSAVMCGTRNSNKGFGREPRAKAIMSPLGVSTVMSAHAIVGTVTKYVQSNHPDIGE